MAFHDATREQVTAKMQLAESVGSIETSDLAWDLYGAEFEWPNAGRLAFDIALSDSESEVYLIMLVTLADEHELLHEAVMLPAMNALAPANITEDWPVHNGCLGAQYGELNSTASVPHGVFPCSFATGSTVTSNWPPAADGFEMRESTKLPVRGGAGNAAACSLISRCLRTD